MKGLSRHRPAQHAHSTPTAPKHQLDWRPTLAMVRAEALVVIGRASEARLAVPGFVGWVSGGSVSCWPPFHCSFNPEGVGGLAAPLHVATSVPSTPTPQHPQPSLHTPQPPNNATPHTPTRNLLDLPVARMRGGRVNDAARQGRVFRGVRPLAVCRAPSRVWRACGCICQGWLGGGGRRRVRGVRRCPVVGVEVCNLCPNAGRM